MHTQDVGFKRTQAYVQSQTDYAVDKIMRAHEDRAQNLTILDAGCGGGYMGANAQLTISQAIGLNGWHSCILYKQKLPQLLIVVNTIFVLASFLDAKEALEGSGRLWQHPLQLESCSTSMLFRPVESLPVKTCLKQQLTAQLLCSL